MKESDDARLVALALDGQHEAFETIVDRYQRVIYSLAMKMVNNADHAADITQNVFVKVYLNLRSYKPEFRFFSWIYRIAMNEALNFVESLGRQPDRLDDSVTGSDNPEHLTERAELAAKMHDAIDRMKPEHKAVVVLIHFEELSYRDAAEILGIPEKTVKSRLYTARQILKDLLVAGGTIEEEDTH